MKVKSKQSGLSLMEMAVIIATIALLAGLGVPAVRALIKSFETEGTARSMISAALATARAIAAKEQKYAGIRFQKAYNRDDPSNLLDAPQYMIFIVHEEPRKMGNLTIGFRVVEGLKPIKLPDSVGVMDLIYRPDLPPGDGNVDSDVEINNLNIFRDTTSFSIVFSSSGKLIIHDVRVRNRDGKTEGTETPDISRDDVFNTLTKITDIANPVGMFIQDDYLILGLYKEPSRNSFIIYEREEFKRAYERGRAWSEYLVKLVPDRIYINPYIGTIISQE